MVNSADAGHVKAFASVPRGEPCADGQNDSVGNQVAGENPGGLIGAGAERLPAICGRAILAMEVSSTSMNVASVTVSAISSNT